MAATSSNAPQDRVTLALITTVLDSLALVLALAAVAVLAVEFPIVGGLLAGAVLLLALSWAITRTQSERER